MKTLNIQEKKDIPFQVKSNQGTSYKDVDMSKRTVDLIANTYWWFDSDYDVLVTGCCAKSIKERGPGAKMDGKIKHADSHDLRKIVGRCDLLEETSMGGNDVLHANSYFPETIDSETVLIKYQNGLIDQHSIGYRYLDIEYIDKEADQWEDILSKLINPEEAEERGILFLVKEIELFEYSNVAFGANRLTPYLGAKSDNINVQYNNLVAKMDALHKEMRTGGEKDLIRMEELQIKQMIRELVYREPSPKDTATPPSKENTFDVGKAIDIISIY